MVRFIGSFAFTGFFPFAPATFASFVFLLLYLVIPGGEALASWPLFVAMLLLSVPVSSAMEKEYGRDAGCIVIDEIVAMQLIFLAASPGTGGAFLAFFLFRVFDVLKPFPAGACQSLRRGWGVVADDLVSAVYTRASMMVLSLLFAKLGDFGL